MTLFAFLAMASTGIDNFRVTAGPYETTVPVGSLHHYCNFDLAWNNVGRVDLYEAFNSTDPLAASRIIGNLTGGVVTINKTLPTSGAWYYWLRLTDGSGDFSPLADNPLDFTTI